MEVAMKILFMTLDVVVYDRPPKGLIILFDMRGVSTLNKEEFSTLRRVHKEHNSFRSV